MPRPGDFGVTATPGLVARLIRLVTHSTVNHAFVYVGDGLVIEAQMRAGMSFKSASRYPAVTWSNLPLTDTQRAAIVAWSRWHLRVPYNYLDILALFLTLKLGWVAPRWARRMVANPNRLICSEAVDLAYQAASVQLINDGRPPCDVTPGDLFDVIERSAADDGVVSAAFDRAHQEATAQS